MATMTAADDDAFEAEEGTAAATDDGADLEDVPVGEHSLPHPFEIVRRPDPEHQRKVDLRRKRALLAVGGLFALSVVLVLVFSFFGPREADGPGAWTAAGGGPGGGGGGSEQQQAEMTDEERHAAATRFLLDSSVSDPSDLSDPSSPQSVALMWMTAYDPRRLPIPQGRGGLEELVIAERFLQRYALTVVFHALGGPWWRRDLNFLTAESECRWFENYRNSNNKLISMGAACTDEVEPDRVSRIWIPWMHNLTGTIPREIEQLTNLYSISMGYENITGTIPPAICSLPRLLELGLSNNLLSGSLPPSMSDMYTLRLLLLDDNKLRGDISSLSELERLEYLYLEDNAFSGDFASAFPAGKLRNLVHLDLSDNLLHGTIPPHMFDHLHYPKLRVLDLHDNSLSGTLPSDDMERQSTLGFLALHKNNLTGTIPPAIGNLSGLIYLDIAHNSFSGEISPAIGELRGLKYLFAGGNGYDGADFPLFVSNLTDLLELSFKDSNIAGTIPDWIGALSNLYLLDLDGNELTGSLPESMGNLTNLMYLLLNRNKLNGTVPVSFANMSRLEMFLLDDNSLTGNLNALICPALVDPSINKTVKIAADCGGSDPEIVCNSACCPICCEDEGEPCNDEKWIVNNDPIWEHRYGRYRFEFEN